MIQTKKAFTLVELIVVIVILAILGTISFISLQNYSSSARDTKRITDIKSLLTKIELEHIKGVSYSQLINSGNGDFSSTTGTGCHTGNVLRQPNIKICQGPVDFGAINENQMSFQDPLSTKSKPIDYIFAYTSPVMIDVGNGKTETREFIQGGIINENGNAIITGNYYQSNTDTEENGGDVEGLILGDKGEPLVNQKSGSITSPITPGVSHNSTAGEITISYGGSTYIIADKNLGATEVYSGTEKPEVRGDYYQWGNNYGFPNTGSVLTGATQVDTTGYGPQNYYYSGTFIAGYSDWSNVQNDNLWGNTTNTKIARQGPCPSNYHVPSTEEWDGLIKTWFSYKGASCTAGAGNYCNWSGNAILADFKSDLKLPLAGQRDRNDGSFNSQYNYGFYWSSSPKSSSHARRLHFYLSNVGPQYDYYRTFGFSVRCFKN